MAHRTRTKPDFNAEGGGASTSGDRYGREAGAVLSVLVLATFWSGRFTDGWVTDEDFGHYSRDLPKPRANKGAWRDSLKRYVRRGLEELANQLSPDAIERRPVGGPVVLRDPRENATRLRHPPAPLLGDWFQRFGLDRLDPEAREAFRRDSYGSLGTLANHTMALDEAIIQRLIEFGDLDEAARQGTQALERAQDEYGRRTFLLVLATIELRREDPSATLRAMDLLRPLVAASEGKRGLAERVLEGRTLTTFATALAFHAFDTLTHETGEARKHLNHARQLVPAENHSDRGDLWFAEGVIEDQEFIFEVIHGNREDAYPHRAKAELALLTALGAWRLAQRWDRIRDGLSYLFQIPGGLSVEALDLDRHKFLIPWLVAVRRYWELRPPRDELQRQTISFDSAILAAFAALPEDVPLHELPLPPRECCDLVDQCLLSEMRERKFLRIRRTAWYRAARGQREKGAPETSDAPTQA